ncbi:hypothetical protein vseg_019455 [Gypsophila vaccaria]
MLSTISPFFQPEPVLGCGKGFGYGGLFASSQGGFTPWENLESFFISHEQKSDHDVVGKDGVSKPKSEPNLNYDQVGSDLGLDDSNQNLSYLDETRVDHESSPSQNSVVSNSGSDDPNRNPNDSNHPSPSHYCDPDQTDERKRKRKLSNRESARRARKRKQEHLQNLRNEADRLEREKQEGTNRLGLMIHNLHLITNDNNRLKAECVILQRRLMELNQIWQIQQFHRNNTTNQS